MADKNPVVVMVAGQPRKGKSTALNNLFSLNLEARMGPKSVTKRFVPKKVVRGGQVLLVVDTPGLGALDLPIQTAIDDIVEHTRGLDFVLIYCLSVSPDESLTETNERIITDLNKYLHKGIWKKCILLLTFSDIAKEQEEFENNDEEYVEYLREHANEFEKLLKKKEILYAKVHTIFDYESAKHREDTTLEGIVAVPVAKSTSTTCIMPGINLEGCLDWTDVAYNELVKKADPGDRVKFLDFKYAATAAGGVVGGVAAGGAAGAGVGAAIGVVGGPIGIGIGATIGGVAGGIAGGTTGISISSIYRYLKWKKQNPDKMLEKLLNEVED